MDRKLLHVVVCAALSGSTALAAGSTDVDYGATVVTGFDSNPLRVSKVIASEPGIFGQLRLDGGLKHPLGPAFSFFANGEIRGRFHDAAMRNADFGSGRATVGLQLAPRNAPRFLLAAGARYAAVRRTYTDRATGQIYEVRSNPDPDPPSTVEIGDRLVMATCGAYGISRAANYNTRRLPAEVWVEDGSAHVIRRRQSYADLARDYVDPDRPGEA